MLVLLDEVELMLVGTCAAWAFVCKCESMEGGMDNADRDLLLGFGAFRFLAGSAESFLKLFVRFRWCVDLEDGDEARF